MAAAKCGHAGCAAAGVKPVLIAKSGLMLWLCPAHWAEVWMKALGLLEA